MGLIKANLSGFPGDSDGNEFACQYRRHSRHGFDPWVGKIPWRRKWQPTPVLLPGEFHRQRSLVGYSPWSLKELDTTEQLTHRHILQGYLGGLNKTTFGKTL